MSEARELAGAEGMKKLGDLIGNIKFAMLTTAAKDGRFESRPMARRKRNFREVSGSLLPRIHGKSARSPKTPTSL